MGTAAAMRRGALAAQEDKWPRAWENQEGFQRGRHAAAESTGDAESCPPEARKCLREFRQKKWKEQCVVCVIGSIESI